MEALGGCFQQLVNGMLEPCERTKALGLYDAESEHFGQGPLITGRSVVRAVFFKPSLAMRFRVAAGELDVRWQSESAIAEGLPRQGLGAGNDPGFVHERSTWS